MKENNQFEETEMIKNSLPVAESSIVRVSEEAEWDEFGNDLYAIPDMLPQQSSSQLQEAVPPPSRADEDSKIKALIDTSALDWQRQTQEFGSGRGFGRGFGGRMMTGRGFGRGAGPDKRAPPQSYICYRCKVPGHFIQHCPTNGDPTMILGRSSHLQEFQNPCWWLPWKDLILCLVVQLLCLSQMKLLLRKKLRAHHLLNHLGIFLQNCTAHCARKL